MTKIKLAGERQLHTNLPNLKLYSHHFDDKIQIKDGANLPFLVWPNGTPCIVANLYMLVLRDNPGRSGAPLSRRGAKGGTIGDYAGKISQLIRFCYREHLDFLELTDIDFSNFISELRKQRFERNQIQRQKNESTLIKTGQICLKFLQFIGNLAGRQDFVSTTGTIKISNREYFIRNGRRETIKLTTMYHHTFSEGESGDPRNPISKANISKLRQAIDDMPTSRFINQRRHLHLSFLEHAGPRRGELSALTVSAIDKASKMSKPMLDFITLKQGTLKIRQVPVTNILLSQARKFINTQRAEAMKNYTKSGKLDHDQLFVSFSTGKPLADTGITNEIHILRKAAGIEEQACAHMFRHAFCTNLFVTLFEQHKFSSSKEFEIRLLTDQFFFSDVRQWTGHKTLEGLLPYINRAYSSINRINHSISIAHLLSAQDQFDTRLTLLCQDLLKGLAPREFVSEIKELMLLRNEDYRSIERTNDE
ncbi:site-specific integrase [Pseudomonas sp.]|uniref:tyrosine-type recombinase/integrase n=1 Tax=Pseudomonas sp. TaxID=306 RepID=UPI0031B6017D